MATTYTVKKGDTLSQIALNNNTTVAKLVELNDITNPDYIVVGQVIKLSGTPTVTTVGNWRATIKAFGLQSNTDRTVYATWTWPVDNTEHYQILWYYDTGDGVWFEGTNTTVKIKQSTYNAPSNASRVRFFVKPISKTYKKKNKTRSYWTANWTTQMDYSFADNPPVKPPKPSIAIDEKRKFTTRLDNLDVKATHIEFQIVFNDVSVYKTVKIPIKTGTAAYSCTLPAGFQYKVRCRSYRAETKEYSGWSEYSDNVDTVPYAPTKIMVLRATSATSVYLEWDAVTSAETYELEYTTKKDYFEGSDQTTSITGINNTRYEKTGLETGHEYFFRLRAVNRNGASVWSAISSIVIGKDPAAPTTWSSTTTGTVGESITLYWVHNSEDGSSQVKGELELIVDGVKSIKTIVNTTDEEERDKTSSYLIDTSSYDEGTKIQWRVRTCGVTGVYGDWSVQRTVDIYSIPTLQFNVTDATGEVFAVLKAFPINVYAAAGPNTQTTLGYHLSISSTETYETVDEVGAKKVVGAGQDVYSKNFDISEILDINLSANDVDLVNNVVYKISCVVTMNSGLTAEESVEFTVGWADEEYIPNAEIIFDEETYTMSIRPFCEDWSGNVIEGVKLAVYRREFDGRFTELMSGINNGSNEYITDPHPALDFARYRIVATSDSTGAVSFYDAPGYPIEAASVIIQWDEEWSSFDTWNGDERERKPWGGSMLKLPYNIDVSDNNTSDVALVEYIGRSHPVSYYGTQLGVKSTWNVAIPKNDEETLYALRRLSVWMGDVYVREPSGSGYWANVAVSFSQKHKELTIPVTLNITRVEGGA